MAKVSSYTAFVDTDVVDADIFYAEDSSAGTSGARKMTFAVLRAVLGRLGLNAPTTMPFQINGTTQLNLTDGALSPETDDDVDLGSSSKKFKDGYFDGVVNTDDLVVATKTPASASDTGTAGMIAWDSDYIYVCTATDTWKRVGISTW